MSSISFDERVGLMVDAEWRARDNAQTARLLKEAKLPCTAACLEDIDYDPTRNLERSVIAQLSDMLWISEHRNVFITGPSGVGKTWVASAFGNAACRLGKKVATYRMSRLLEKLSAARIDRTWGKLLASLKKPDLLILDDFGLDILDAVHCRDLLEIVEDRYGVGSILITAQLPVVQWHGVFEDSTVADATLDRLVHNSVRIELRGRSKRGAAAADNP
ncbi:ATPase AAA [Clostridia bacterium]|nr:ATPase AAA [Clostridia bacterium]